MYSSDVSELDDFQSGSHLLSQSPLLPSSSASSSRTGPSGDNLSLSELSLTNRPLPGPSRRPKFSLLAQPRDQSKVSDDSAITEDTSSDASLEVDQTMTQEDVEKAKKLAARTREEKLQHDLYILKRLNSAFEVYKEALKEAQSSTQRVAAQLEHTNALLDKYVNILSKSEDMSRLILDERWQGGDADEETIWREQQETIERMRLEEEERVLAAQRERERLEREERETKEREAREQQERERAEVARQVGRGSGVRGVRGTRASMRGMAATTRIASTASMRGNRGGTTTGIARRPTSSASTRSTATSRATRRN